MTIDPSVQSMDDSVSHLATTPVMDSEATASDAGATPEGSVAFPDPALANVSDSNSNDAVQVCEAEAAAVVDEQPVASQSETGQSETGQCAGDQSAGVAKAESQESAPVRSPLADTELGQADASRVESTESDQQLSAALSQTCLRLVNLLFGIRGASQTDITAAIGDYSLAWQKVEARGVSSPNGRDPLLDLIQERLQRVREQDQAELQSAGVAADCHLATYEKLSKALDVLIQDVSTIVSELNDQAIGFPAADEALHPALLNHKKGVEIIQRMIGRVADRRKNLSSERPTGEFQAIEPMIAPENPAQLDEVVTQWSKSLTLDRQNRDRVVVAVRDFAESCRKGVTGLAKSLLPAIDGIDSGLVSEPAARQQWLSLGEELTAERSSLIDKWFSCYDSLCKRLDEFLLAAGLEAQVVVPGVPFDPETMEPVSTVGHPEFAEDSVAAVVRRGFAIAGENLRPVAVEVVRNH